MALYYCKKCTNNLSCWYVREESGIRRISVRVPSDYDANHNLPSGYSYCCNKPTVGETEILQIRRVRFTDNRPITFVWKGKTYRLAETHANKVCDNISFIILPGPRGALLRADRIENSRLVGVKEVNTVEAFSDSDKE